MSDDVSGWQPIETAPKDIDVLLYCPERGPANHERIELRDYGSTKGGYVHSWATHWMPIPAPPIEASLKPCPFCGQQPKVETWMELDRTWPEPNDCKRMEIRCCESFDSAEAWNNRVNGE
jgi:hypothetical protein